MKTKPSFRSLVLSLLAVATITSQLPTAFAQGSAFTYQGRLNTGGTLANGSYDLQFALCSAASGPAQLGSWLTNSATAVSNGLFTVTLDFGSQFPGAARWLEIGVRSNGLAGFSTLVPRQPITPTPYAITAGNITGGGAALTNLNASQLASGTVADVRLSPNVALRNGGNTFSGGNQILSGDKLIVQGNNPVDTATFTGLSLQYYTGFGEGAIMSAYDDGFGFLSFYTKAGGGQPITQRMVITKDGDVGVGMNAPSAKLEVLGTIKATAFVGDGSNLTNLPSSGGGSVKLVDGNNVTLGRVIAADRNSAVVLTATGYQVDIPFDGVFFPAQIYYTGTCATPGAAYLNDGGGGTLTLSKISGKYLVYSGSLGTLMESDSAINGVATNSVFSAQSFDNPTCGASIGTRSGWKLKPITRVAAGLPNTLALPIILN